MAEKKTKSSKDITSDGFAYLTKRTVVAKAQAAGKAAADSAMAVMGHIITAENGWIVKRYQDGRVENISPVQP